MPLDDYQSVVGTGLKIKTSPSGSNKLIFKSKDGAVDSGSSGSDGDPLCNGPQVAYALDTVQGDIDVTLRLGTLPVLDCATFGPEPTDVLQDGSNGRIYAARNAPEPASCTSP